MEWKLSSYLILFEWTQIIALSLSAWDIADVFILPHLHVLLSVLLSLSKNGYYIYYSFLLDDGLAPVSQCVPLLML